MKIYAPWKPHIIQLRDKFYIRKWSWAHWAYLDRNMQHWWMSTDAHSCFDDADKAADVLLEYPAYRKKQKDLRKTKKLDTEKLLQQSRTRKVLQLDAVEEEATKPYTLTPKIGDFKNSVDGSVLVYDGSSWQPLITLNADSTTSGSITTGKVWTKDGNYKISG